MIRLTILYNLPPGSDEDAFLRWRLAEHQASNASVGGVLRTDFSRVDEQWPGAHKPPYRFMTTVDFADRQSFEAGFLSEPAQAKLEEDLKRVADPLFLVSEVLTETKNDS